MAGHCNNKVLNAFQVSGVQETHQKRFLSDTITRLHIEFVRRHGQISRGRFFSLRPKWVLPPKDLDRLVHHLLLNND